MRNIEVYYENTKNKLPNKNIQEFINMNTKTGKAIELGCGVGSDTVFLIKNNWEVLAIDRENTKKFILDNLNEEEKKRFKFKLGEFENLELEKNDLIVSNYALPFCKKDCFLQVWKNVTNSISKGGYFVGNFFGVNDSWNKVRNDMIFLNKEQVLNLFKSFDIVKFEEIEKDGKSGLGKFKHWHIFEIIARKK